MFDEVNLIQQELSTHPLYSKLNTIENMRTFMKYHVFAVWDFMSLLKSLQREITCVSIPWRESHYSPQLVRLINEITLGEESDIDHEGKPNSHYSLYLKAMEEIGVDTSPIRSVANDFDLTLLPDEIQEIITYHIELSQNGKVHEVASSFFFGREKLIPLIFDSLVKAIEKDSIECPTLLYYLKRHIEVDGDDHGPKAMLCLSELTDTELKKKEALVVARTSLAYRKKLWDFIYKELTT
jgi:hypothetical protein